MSHKEKTIAGTIVTLVTLLTMGIVVFLATAEESDSRANITTQGTHDPLRQVQDWDDLRTKISDQLADWTLQQHGLASANKRARRPAPSSADALAAPTRRAKRSTAEAGVGRAGPSHYTGTNNQVAGVEEADIVQTDGKHIYTIHKRQLLIIKSWPASQTAIVARHRLDARSNPRELFVARDRLVILSGVNGAKTRITVLDITRRSQPRVLKEIELGGQLGQSRLMGRKLYLVTTSPMRLPRAVTRAISTVDWTPLNNTNRWDPVLPAAVQQMRSQVSRRIRQVLDRRDLERLLPQVTVLGPGGQVGPARRLHSPQDLFVPSTGSRPGLLSLTRIDLDRFDLKSTGIMAHGSKVYASAGAFYVAQPSRRWWRGRGSHETTRIHKFSLGDGEQSPSYAASGTVRGSLLNQFSMDEHKGYLRVATTERSRRRWSRRRGRTGRARGRGWGRNRGRGRRSATFTAGGNHIHVLAQRGSNLEVVGAVTGLAKGERIYSARFLGDEGYIVTFRKTDPLFTIDLSNPRLPRVMGELKVNGYSSYMHPLGRRTLLTIGQDATSTGRATGVHLQIFDVSDLTNPRRTHHHKLNIGSGRSWSQAQSNHHAFTYDPKSGVLAFPLTLRDYKNPENNFVGLMLVAADPWSGLREIGRIDHANLSLGRPGQPCIITAAGHCAPRRARTGLRAPKMQRSLIIDGYIYSLSNLGLKVNGLRNPDTEVARVVFAQR
jgi:uncharacterized secreted protein with C-terminal beta-propeller domain